MTGSGQIAHDHPGIKDVIARLKRAEGHLRSTIEMALAGRPCMDVAQQLQAVESAIGNAKRFLIQNHINHCLEEVTGDLPRKSRGLLDEFKAVAKFL
jgi:hypothetical protein NreA